MEIKIMLKIFKTFLVPLKKIKKSIKRIGFIKYIIKKNNQKWKKYPSYNHLTYLMEQYQVKNLANVEISSFKSEIYKMIDSQDSEVEGFKDVNKQRDLSIKFHWGHNHNFGEFALSGRMKDNHFRLIATFIDEFQTLPYSLENKYILDIGCWTGGTSLLLSAMGANIVAIEEVKKYIDALNYLKKSFNISKIDPRNISLYDCDNTEYQNRFDYVLFAGVLYHITDPLIALRIVFNSLKTDGIVLLETAVIKSKNNILSYVGPEIIGTGDSNKLNRGGWNWFVPSVSSLIQMMKDVGFEEIRVNKIVNGRVFAVGKKNKHVDIMRSGLSVKNIL